MNLFTAGIDRTLLGYRILTVEEKYRERAASLLLGAGITAGIDAAGSFRVRERDLPRVEKLFQGRIVFTVGECRGLRGAIMRIKHKVGISVGAGLSLLLVIFLSSVVWDVRIEGNEAIPDAAVRLMLEEAGFSVGDIWGFRDKSEIETKLLSAEPSIAWININRRGTVAYVQVAESEGGSDEDEVTPVGYANIVATADCVIEEITVRRGTALVKAGDTVMAGQILIEGILPAEVGGGLCYAEGSVFGRVFGEVSVEVAREYTETMSTEERLCGFSVKLFKKTINILKTYGNSPKECDIIEEINSYALFGKRRLPLTVVRKYERSYSEAPATYTDTELTAIARQRMDSELAKRLATSDLIGIRSEGGFTDSGYCLTSYLVYCTEVGEASEFNVTRERN